MLNPLGPTEPFSPLKSFAPTAQSLLNRGGLADLQTSTLTKAIDPTTHVMNLYSPCTLVRQCVKSLMTLSAGASTVFRANRQAEIREFTTALKSRDDGHIQYVYYRLHHTTREIITVGNPGLFARYLFMMQPAEKQRLKNELIARSDRAYVFQQMLHPFDLAAEAFRTVRSIAHSLAQIASSVPRFFSPGTTSETVVYDDKTDDVGTLTPTSDTVATTTSAPQEEELLPRPTPRSRLSDFVPTIFRTREPPRASTPVNPRLTPSTAARTAANARPTVPGTAVYTLTAIPNEVTAKRREIIELSVRFYALANPPATPAEFSCPISFEIMALPVFSVSHPAIQDALNLPAGTERDEKLANRSLRHTLDSVSMESWLSSNGSRANCQTCRHPISRADLRIDFELQDDILAFLRQHVR